MAYNPDLYTQLLAAGPVEQLDTASNLVDAMRREDGSANDTYWRFVHSILEEELHDMTDEGTMSQGEFRPADSADLVRSIPRASGFLNAIAKVGETREIASAIDVGTGASGLLAVGFGVLYPRAEIQAVELNPKAARCAERVLQLFGLSGNRITVRQGNVFTMDLDDATTGATETYGAGVATEPGVEISYLLSQKTEVILPGRIDLFAQDAPFTDSPPDDTLWKHATTLDLAERNPLVVGRVTKTNDGPRYLTVYSGLYTSDGEAIVAEPSSDPITEPLVLGVLPEAPAGSVFEFIYPTGARLGSRNISIQQVA